MPVHNHFLVAGEDPASPVSLPLSPAALMQAGPILAIEVGVPTALAKALAEKGDAVPAAISGFALIDTGATRSCVDDAIIRALGVQPIGVIEVGTAGGKRTQSLYPARFTLRQVSDLSLEFSSVLGADLEGHVVADQRIVALIGRDFLMQCVLVYNGPGGFFTVSF